MKNNLNEIIYNFKLINSRLPIYATKEKYLNIDDEKIHIKLYVSPDKEPKKMVITVYAKDKKRIEEYYYNNEKLIFVYKRTEFYNNQKVSAK